MAESVFVVYFCFSLMVYIWNITEISNYRRINSFNIVLGVFSFWLTIPTLVIMYIVKGLTWVNSKMNRVWFKW